VRITLLVIPQHFLQHKDLLKLSAFVGLFELLYTQESKAKLMMFFWVLAEALKMETACFSEMLASTGESTRRQNSEEHHHPHRRENLKSHKSKAIDASD
jgi:hypothetical protein